MITIAETLATKGLVSKDKALALSTLGFLDEMEVILITPTPIYAPYPITIKTEAEFDLEAEKLNLVKKNIPLIGIKLIENQLFVFASSKLKAEIQQVLAKIVGKVLFSDALILELKGKSLAEQVKTLELISKVLNNEIVSYLLSASKLYKVSDEKILRAVKNVKLLSYLNIKGIKNVSQKYEFNIEAENNYLPLLELLDILEDEEELQ